jgi:hypothetical protein
MYEYAQVGILSQIRCALAVQWFLHSHPIRTSSSGHHRPEMYMIHGSEYERRAGSKREQRD